MAHELTRQYRVDTCADYCEVFLQERGVREGARVFRCQVSVGRGEEVNSKTRAEFEGVREIEGRGRWVACRLCGLGEHRGQHALRKFMWSVPGLVGSLARRSTKCSLFVNK